MTIEFQVKTFFMDSQLGLDLGEAQKQRILQINELDEMRQDALQRTMLVQSQCKKWHDKFIKQKKFQTRDWALLFDSRYKTFRGKLTMRWLGLYEIVIAFDNGSVRIKTIDESEISFVVKGHKLRIYHKPTLRQEFLQDISQ